MTTRILIGDIVRYRPEYNRRGKLAIVTRSISREYISTTSVELNNTLIARRKDCHFVARKGLSPLALKALRSNL